MKLRVVLENPDEHSFSVFVNGESKQLYDVNEEAVFELNEARNYKIKLIQNKSFNNHTIIMIILFVITSIIQGVVNIFLLNTNSKWYKNITPFIISKDFDIFISTDKTLVIKYTNGYFDEAKGTFSKPTLYCNGEIQENCFYNYNLVDFYNQYFVYVKRVLSVGLICEIIFFVLILISINNHIYPAIIVCSIVFTALLFLQLFLLIKEYKFLKKILKINNNLYIK